MQTRMEHAHTVTLHEQPTRTQLNHIGAPETFRSESLETVALDISPSADLWSLGCVYSECATWVVAGYGKVREYRRRRGEELQAKHKRRMGELFHDDHHTLNIVASHHDAVARGCRNGDFITTKVLKDLVNHMILDNPDVRFNAKQLHHYSQRIVREAREEMNLMQPQSFNIRSWGEEDYSARHPDPPSVGDKTETKPEQQEILSRHGEKIPSLTYEKPFMSLLDALDWKRGHDPRRFPLLTGQLGEMLDHNDHVCSPFVLRDDS